MSHKLVAISGKKQSGKDTIADYLVEKHGYKKMAFADPLKEGTMLFFRLTREQCYDNKQKEVEDPFWHLKPREILQLMGTEVMQLALDEAIRKSTGTNPWWGRGFWSQRLKRELQKIFQSTKEQRIVICDMRFEHEAHVIESLDGYLIRVSRTVTENSIDTHASETSLDDYSGWHEVISNDTTIENLYNKVESFLIRRNLL